MNKDAFLKALRRELSGLPRQELEEQLCFYSEMIDDRVEEGLTEEQAVAQLGSVSEIVAQIPAQVMSKSQRKTWQIVLLAAGSPLWLPLAIACVAVIISLYAALWSVIVALWTALGALVVSAVGAVIAGAVLLITGNSTASLALLGAGLICAGLSIFWFCGSRGATNAAVWLTKLPFRRKQHV